MKNVEIKSMMGENGTSNSILINRKKRIMIDMDDVLCDYNGFLGIVNMFLGSKYTIDDVKGYYIQDLIPIERKEEFTKFFVTKNVYDYCKIMDNCVEVIKELNEKFDVYICTAYVFRDDISYSADSLKYKFLYLMEKFPYLNPNNFTFMTNKTIFDCDVKIDDKISNLDGAEIKILYDAYHNRHITDEELKEKNVIRATNWLEIKDILNSLE